jgi:short-subunit dehydrogenase
MHKGLFEEMEYDKIAEMIHANINSVTFMTRFVLQNMTRQQTQCAVINIGSATAASLKSKGRF